LSFPPEFVLHEKCDVLDTRYQRAGDFVQTELQLQEPSGVLSRLKSMVKFEELFPDAETLKEQIEYSFWKRPTIPFSNTCQTSRDEASKIFESTFELKFHGINAQLFGISMLSFALPLISVLVIQLLQKIQAMYNCGDAYRAFFLWTLLTQLFALAELVYLIALIYYGIMHDIWQNEADLDSLAKLSPCVDDFTKVDEAPLRAMFAKDKSWAWTLISCAGVLILGSIYTFVMTILIFADVIKVEPERNKPLCFHDTLTFFFKGYLKFN